MLRFSMLALGCILAVPLTAQAPQGWHERVDRSTNASDPDNTPDVKFVTMGPGFHVTTGPAVVLWKDANAVAGAYTLKGRFRLVKPSGHTNYYGLVFGGKDLATAAQTYMYFLVAQNGTFLVKHRAGDAETHDVVAKTPNAAIIKPDSTGSATNMLEVRVTADKVDYVVNGTVVHTMKKADVVTDGTWGVRVNHVLEIHMDQLAASK